MVLGGFRSFLLLVTTKLLLKTKCQHLITGVSVIERLSLYDSLELRFSVRCLT